MENKKDIVWRLYLAYVVMFLLALAVVGKVLYIQIVQGKVWRDKSKANSLNYFDISANRGNIYDASGEFLATSVPLFEVRMDVASPYLSDEMFVKKVDALALSLSNYFKDRSKSEYRSLLLRARDDGNRYLLLRRNVTYDGLKALRKFPIFNGKLTRVCLIAEPDSRRILPYKQLASRTIGWYKEGEGAKNVGLENSFQKYLEGKTGRRLMQFLPGGNWRPINSANQVDPMDGADVISTIDIHLQDVAEDALARQLAAVEADHGCAILMEVKTGEIKAIANLGKNKTGEYVENYNYAIGESTEPGSTFKLFSLLAALNDGKIKSTDIVDCEGGTVRYADRIMRDSHGGLFDITVQEAFEKSSNCGVSKAIMRAYGDNPQAFCDRLKSFLMDKKLGLEIAGEGYPRMKDTRNKYWSKVSLPWMSIGYEVALAPIQILAFYNAVANNGVMVKPRFVKEVRRGGEIIHSSEPIIINPMIASPSAIRVARNMMEGVVEKGTGTALRSAAYRVAGKTGTAMVAKGNKGYNKSDYKGSFVGYFPAERPKYSCIVVINNPNTAKGYYGGTIAAPVFREISDRVYANDPEMGHDWADTLRSTNFPTLTAGYSRDVMSLSRMLGCTYPTSPTGWFGLSNDSINKTIKPIQSNPAFMPNVVGMSLKDAVYLLEKNGLRVRFSGMGLVKKQSLQAGSPVMKGKIVILDVAV